MFDDEFNQSRIVDFDHLANLLLEQGLQCSPSEIHGCITGLLSAGARPDPQWCVTAMEQSLNVDLHGELVEQSLDLVTITSSALRDDDFDFHPLMPDDETELESRTQALAEWCQGFVAGFAVGSTDTKISEILSGDCNEILSDLAAIAQAEPDAQRDEDQDQDQDQDEDDAEQSLFELVEYVRIAALNVFLEVTTDLDEEYDDENTSPDDDDSYRIR